MPSLLRWVRCQPAAFALAGIWQLVPAQVCAPLMLSVVPARLMTNWHGPACAHAGEWHNDKRHGQGVCKFADGRKFKGEAGPAQL